MLQRRRYGSAPLACVAVALALSSGRTEALNIRLWERAVEDLRTLTTAALAWPAPPGRTVNHLKARGGGYEAESPSSEVAGAASAAPVATPAAAAPAAAATTGASTATTAAPTVAPLVSRPPPWYVVF